MIVSGISGVVTGDENTIVGSDHAVTIVDAKGIVDVSQLGVIPLGQTPDERITVEAMIANNENMEISGLRIRSFLVRDGREDTISLQLGSDFRDVVLKPGELKTFKRDFAVSKQLKPGDYKVMIRVDSNATAQEKDTDYTQFISNQIVKIGAYADAGGATPVYSPTKLEKPGSYLIMRDISGGSTDNVIKIASSDVTLDGGGHIIRGTSTGYNSGVYVDGGSVIKDIIVKNCIFEGVDFGLWLYRVESASITNCIFRNCTNIGLRFDQVRATNIADNRFEDNELGLGLFQSSGNTATNNYFKNKFNVVVNEGQKNTWNTDPVLGVNIIGGVTKAGNAWFDLNGSGFSVSTPDQNNDGIADIPYSINGVNIDYYPLSAGLSQDSSLSEQETSVPEVIIEPAPTLDSNENMTEGQEHEKNIVPSPEPESDESIPDQVSVPPVLPEPTGVEGVDLTILDINTTNRTCLNTEFPINITIANKGNLEAEFFSVHYYLSEDTSITNSDRDVGSFQVDTLLPMGNETYTGKISLPPGIPIKYYSIGVIVDPENDIYESNKQNNAQISDKRLQITDC